MYYCPSCHTLNNDSICSTCHIKHLTLVQPEDACFLIEKESPWANMLEEMLANNSIAYVANPIVGAGISARIGATSEVYRFYVPYEYYSQAADIIQTMFPNEK